LEGKNRSILVVLIAAVIVLGVFASFGLNLFTAGTPSIVLPTPQATLTPAPGGEEDNSGAKWVEVTPQTVQEVIATLARPLSYQRTVTLQDFWGDGQSAVTTAEVTVDDGWTMTVSERGDRSQRTSIVGGGMVYWWYSGDATAQSAPADNYSADLEGQRIPTYEDILQADPDSITAAGYESKNGVPCVYVSIHIDGLEYEERYWVSTENGLLAAAQTVQDDAVLMEMAAGAAELPAPAGLEFAGPDRTVYHQVSD